MDGKRNRKGADTLSGIGIVVRALARCGIDVGDATSVQENIWFGPAGEIVRSNTKIMDIVDN